jgi:uncharacterized membrane protein
MEQKKPVSHLVAGLLIAAIMVVYSLILNFMDLWQNQAMGWLAYLIFIIALIVFINQYGKANDYRLGFGSLFGYGFKITAIVTLIVIIFMVVFFLAFPEYKEKMIETSRQAMEDQGNASDEQIDQAMGMMSRNFMLFAAGGALFGYLIMGCIGSLLGAAITKKKPQSPFEQTTL